MNEFCECALAGYCLRHQMKKGQARFNNCKGLGAGKDCGLSYWQNWEQGKLGATAPDNPQLNPKGFCSNKEVPVLIETRSSIGTRLHDLIVKDTGEEINCEECKESVLSLNQMDKKQALKVRDKLIQDMLERAPKVAPKLWQKIGLKLDNLFKAGIAEAKITSWVDLAINQEPDFIEAKVVEQIVKKRI